MTPSTRRIFIVLDADGAKRGFITDGAPVSATIQGDTLPTGFGAGLDVASLPVRAASLMGENAQDAGSLSAVLSLDAFDLWALRSRCPLQKVTVRAWLAPVNGDGIPVNSALTEIDLLPSYEIFRGVLRNPKPDLRARTLQFTAAPDLRLLDAQFPPTVITTERFPDAPTENTSNAVPVVYGFVLGLPLYAVSDVTVNPVKLLVAGHPIQSTGVTIMRDGAIVAASSVLYGIDEFGGAYAYVTVTPVQYAAGSNLYARDVTGWVNPDGTAIDGLGDVLLHLWHTYGNEKFYDLDRVRCYAARDPLNHYKVGMAFNQQETGSGLIRMLQGRLEPQFPVAFGISGGRMGWDCTRIPTDEEIPKLVIGTLTYGLDAHDRIDPQESDAGSVVTSIEMHTVAQGQVGGTSGVLTVNRDNMPVLRGAVTRWGESPLHRIDCPDLSVNDGPWSVATDLAVGMSAVRESPTYLGLDGAWNDAMLYGVVLVTDEECGYEAEPTLVTAVAPTLDGRVNLTLLRIRGV